MGTEITTIVEVKTNGKWVRNNTLTNDELPFNCRNYSVYSFLSGVRNYSHCTPLSDPRGLPNDSEYLNFETEDFWYGEKTTKRQELLEGNSYFFSYFTLKELLDYDYTKEFEDRRYSEVKGNCYNGAAVAEEGHGKIKTYKEYLGQGYFMDLDKLKELGQPENVRVVFWFS